MNKNETRKLPKKTIYIIFGLIILGTLTLLLTSFLKQVKIREMLEILEFHNISNITVYNVSKVTDSKTGIRGDLYKIKFTDKIKKQECFGFVLDQSNRYSKDLDCKEI